MTTPVHQPRTITAVSRNPPGPAYCRCHLLRLQRPTRTVGVPGGRARLVGGSAEPLRFASMRGSPTSPHSRHCHPGTHSPLDSSRRTMTRRNPPHRTQFIRHTSPTDTGPDSPPPKWEILSDTESTIWDRVSTTGCQKRDHVYDGWCRGTPRRGAAETWESDAHEAIRRRERQDGR